MTKTHFAAGLSLSFPEFCFAVVAGEFTVQSPCGEYVPDFQVLGGFPDAVYKEKCMGFLDKNQGGLL